MKIESYRFGRIVIDGTAYTSDIIIAGGTIHPNWQRKQGHLLNIEDLTGVLKAAPCVLIVGCGASAMMKVPEETSRLLEQNHIESEILDTYKAVERFNELSKKGVKDIAAALHLTC